MKIVHEVHSIGLNNSIQWNIKMSQNGPFCDNGALCSLCQTAKRVERAVTRECHCRCTQSTMSLIDGCRLRRCRACRALFTEKSISCAYWITVQTMILACSSRSSFSWWRGRYVSIARSSGGNSAASHQLPNSGCSCRCAQSDCFDSALIHLAILLSLERYVCKYLS